MFRSSQAALVKTNNVHADRQATNTTDNIVPVQAYNIKQDNIIIDRLSSQ